jgi:hypothetical protein
VFASFFERSVARAFGERFITDDEAATTTSAALTISVTDNSITYEEITAPYSKDGIGEFYWKTTDIANYINSWNLDLLEINGVDFTNVWKTSADLPSMQDGYYYIHYKGLFNWSHYHEGLGFGQNVLKFTVVDRI